MRTLLIIIALLILVPAQTHAQVRPEIRPFAGALIPTGDQRDIMHDAVLAGAQVALEVGDRFHVVGTFGYSGPNLDKRIPVRGHVHVYQSDLGGELFRDVSLNENWRFRPFLGLGAGIRTYDLIGTKGSKSYPSGYGALGSEWQMSKIALRLEARDYLTRFKGLSGNESVATRNEITISAGLAYHLR